ncbi:MAG TPA: hypothetical protein VJL29_06525 [Thermoguttaceae bacterium]|nr:hypothetical protein [Thermoguttaceae bacterium]
MKPLGSVILLPVDSLEDLSLDQASSAAESLLTAWTVPFHPAILAAAGVPRWHSVQTAVDSEPTAGSLILVPSLSLDSLPPGWIGRAEAAGAWVIADLSNRDAAVQRILACLDPPPEGQSFDRFNADLVPDLLALGFCRFQVELLTRRQYYMGSLDKEAFDHRAVRAAEAILRGDDHAAREEIQSAFDLLTEGREYFYSLETHLLDLTLVAPSTTGRPLLDELAEPTPKALFLSGRTLVEMAHHEPETLAALKMALTERRIDVLGGEFGEPALALAVPEAILAGIRRGLSAHETHLGVRPVVFARRRHGLAPILPQILRQCGFTAACHFTLDGGRFPTGSQSKIQWEAAGGSPLDTVARVPLDAARADDFLRLPGQLADTMDLDETPTVVLAHWPGWISPWHDALRRMHRYSPTLGRFLGAAAYFEETRDAGPAFRHGPDEYQSPYLVESVEQGEPDPISRWVRYHARQTTIDAIQGLRCMAQTIQSVSAYSYSQSNKNPSRDREGAVVVQGTPNLPAETDELRSAVEDLAENSSPATGSEEQRLGDRLRAQLNKALCGVADALPRDNDSPSSGRLCLNPFSFARDETPAMGFVWQDPEDTAAEPPKTNPPEPKPLSFWRRQPRRKAPPLLAEENVLRNEFFEATIDPATGSLRAIHDYRTRGNRLAAQLALRAVERLDDESGTLTGVYSTMAAERIEVENVGRTEGRIITHGRLVDRHGNRLAGFRQTLTARRGSRVLELDVELTPDRLPDGHPWQTYYAVRFAWNDPTVEMYRSVNLTSWPTEAVRFESPHFIEIRESKRRTTILSGGLPFHRRIGLEKMDCLLIVPGETARRFRLGIGIDVPHPAAAAMDFLAPDALCVESSAPASRSGWLFHVDASNVIATGWETIFRDNHPTGYRVRLLETEGIATTVRLRSFRRPTSARQIDFLGNAQQEPTDEQDLNITNDHVLVPLDAHEWTQLEVHWPEPNP